MTATAITIRPATMSDVSYMVKLSDQKRRDYEKEQPQFWRRSENANECQTLWFASLISKNSSILLVAETQDQIRGFVIGTLIMAPEVYAPGGPTLMIDDFCVEHPDLWSPIGKQLLECVMTQATQKAAVQVLIACGHHDDDKRQFLKSQGLKIVTEWFVGGVV